MKSLKELYRVGKGPSSSHTMGPQRAAKLFQERCPNASYYEVTLYGSLAATGKGHMTDVAIEEVLRPHKTVYPEIYRHCQLHRLQSGCTTLFPAS